MKNVFTLTDAQAREIAELAVNRELKHFGSWVVEQRVWGVRVTKAHHGEFVRVTVYIRLDLNVDVIKRETGKYKEYWPTNNQHTIQHIIGDLDIAPDYAAIEKVIEYFKTDTNR